MQLSSHSEILHFQKRNFFGGGGSMPSDPLLGPKNLSPHHMSVKVLGFPDLPFFIPAGLTALVEKETEEIFSNLEFLSCILRISLTSIPLKFMTKYSYHRYLYSDFHNIWILHAMRT